MAEQAASVRTPRAFPIFPAAVLLLILGLGLVTAGALEWIYAGRIWPGVFIGAVPVGGLTEAEAQARWQATLPDPQRPFLTLQGPGLQRTLSLTDLGASVDIPGTLEEAMRAGRGRGWLDVWDRLWIWWAGYGVAPRVVVVLERLEAQIEALAAAIDRPPQDAALEIREGEVRVIPARAGIRLDRSATRARLLEALSALQPVTLALPVETVLPSLTEVEPARTQLAQWLEGPIHLFVATDTLTVTLPLSATGPWELSPAALGRMIALERVEAPTPHLEARLEEERLQEWLSPIVQTLQADPGGRPLRFR
jgi:hypothetical protein